MRSITEQFTMGYYQGMRVISNPFAYQTKEIKRSWMERLFSLPFHPFRKYKVEVEPMAYIVKNPIGIGKDIIFCHPSIYSKLDNYFKEIQHA